MIRYRAAWVVPVASQPLRDGWVDVDHGRVVAVGQGKAPGGPDALDLGAVALMPGLVNAHTHLELSYLEQRIPPATEFIEWIRGVVSTRRQQPDQSGPEVVAALERAIEHATACGTALVGDITNTLSSVEPLRRSALGGVVFYELIRFNAPDPDGFVDAACDELDRRAAGDRIRLGLAAHAPYSVSPRVFQAIRRASGERRRGVPYSVHVAESKAESQFVATGTGAWREFLGEVGAWDPAWEAHGGTPVEYLETLGFLSPSALAVHGVQATAGDLARLKTSGATLVTCPRSNARTGAGIPSVRMFYQSGVPVAVGTDSLASTPDLNVFAELAALRALAPDVPARRLLESATSVGATALGFGHTYGSIEPGKSGRLLAVTLPPGVADVEEYLVGGIAPEQLEWITGVEPST